MKNNCEKSKIIKVAFEKLLNDKGLTFVEPIGINFRDSDVFQSHSYQLYKNESEQEIGESIEREFNDYLRQNQIIPEEWDGISIFTNIDSISASCPLEYVFLLIKDKKADL